MINFLEENKIFLNQCQRLKNLFSKIPNKQTEIRVFDYVKQYSNYKEFMLAKQTKRIQLNRIFCCIKDTKIREKVLNYIEKLVYQARINEVADELLKSDRSRKGRKRLSETFFKGCELCVEVLLQKLI